MHERTILGYASALSAAPGDTLEFKVSSELEGYYDADLVRLTGGDDPGGAGFSQTPIASTMSGRYPARRQRLHPGSYVEVYPNEVLEHLSEFTFHAVIRPTTPLKGRQCIMGHFDQVSGQGAALVLDHDGSPGLILASDQAHCVSTGTALVAGVWYAVAATYDPEIGRVQVFHQAIEAGLAAHWDAPVVSVLRDEVPAPSQSGAPFRLAAWSEGPSHAGAPWPAGGHFNGKIDSPRILGCVLPATALAELRAVVPEPSFAEAVVAWWDLSRGIGGEEIFDASANALHGETHQLPARAVTGWNWTGKEHCWRSDPAQYGAIHFHDDDLVDAEWETDFALTIPADLRSGVYAARLRPSSAQVEHRIDARGNTYDDAEDDEHIVFFVRPPRATRYRRGAAPVAFLAPTASYLAYANYRLRLKPNPLFGPGDPTNPYDAYLKTHPELGASLYDVHSDWSGVHVSSRHRPLTNVRPRQNRIWGLPADMNIVAWLEHTGIDYEVITDEDLHHEGEQLLGRYRAVLTGSHPEYYTTRMLDAVEQYLAGGGRLMYLGGNGFYWRIAFHPTVPGVIEVRRAEDGTRAWIAEPGEYYQSFDGEYGGLWRRNGRPPNQTVGIGFAAQGFERSAPYRRGPGADNPRAQFAFAGVPDEVIGDFGSLGGGASGEEIDRFDLRLGSPRHALVLATANEHDEAMLRTKEEFLSTVPPFRDPKIRSDLVFFECPNGGAVFSTGSIAWAGALAHQGFDNNVARITENVLRRFADPAPFPAPDGLHA